MKFRFSFLLASAAAAVAGCAAYYSVFGLSQLFAGASLAVIIMASSLEFGKIVTVSFLQRHWKQISITLKTYLTIGVLILVCITSAGIYGFLSNAYQKTAHKLEISNGEIAILTGKRDLFLKSIKDDSLLIANKTNRQTQLTNLRQTQETRLDATTSVSEKNRIRADINTATKEIQKLNTEIDTLNARDVVLTDSANVYSTKIIQAKANDGVAAEIGPLKYLAQLTGYPMDKVVNWFILLLIFVFDPLAVALVVATNKLIQIEGQQPEVPKRGILKPLQNILKKREEITIDPIEEVTETPEVVQPSKPIIDPETGEIDFKYNPIPIEQDYYLTNHGEDAETPIDKLESEPELTEATREPVIPTGSVKLDDIPEVKARANRGFSVDIPKPATNTIQRIGTNKHHKNNDDDKVFFKRKR